jgi:tRNA dimethylallyltransferase
MKVVAALFGKMARPKVLVLTGPTGVGKTDTSIILAQRLNGEIISADSVQVYRGLDIGSDKLPLSERKGVCIHSLHAHHTPYPD